MSHNGCYGCYGCYWLLLMLMVVTGCYGCYWLLQVVIGCYWLLYYFVLVSLVFEEDVRCRLCMRAIMSVACFRATL